MLSNNNSSPRIVLFSLLLSVALSSIAIGQVSTTPTEYRASIGSGNQAIHNEFKGSRCDGPIDSTGDSTVYWGPLTLVSDSTAFWSNSTTRKLNLIKIGDQWLADEVTATGPADLGVGQSTYVSKLSSDGIATTVENGSYTEPNESGTVTSTETIDLNTGKYTWVRAINETQTPDPNCPIIAVETQNRTAALPITLTPVAPSGPLALVASINNGEDQPPIPVTHATTLNLALGQVANIGRDLQTSLNLCSAMS